MYILPVPVLQVLGLQVQSVIASKLAASERTVSTVKLATSEATISRVLYLPEAEETPRRTLNSSEAAEGLLMWEPQDKPPFVILAGSQPFFSG